ncbi:unnamed protein product [Toxocara canis]|uniref:Uncharacterized protein n=1 Tax=Toxocara canis TaxID=6265 RepID=A0A183V6G3_TOXCA|nr:unnamed protein product [Toxocara canis]
MASGGQQPSPPLRSDQQQISDNPSSPSSDQQLSQTSSPKASQPLLKTSEIQEASSSKDAPIKRSASGELQERRVSVNAVEAPTIREGVATRNSADEEQLRSRFRNRAKSIVEAEQPEPRMNGVINGEVSRAKEARPGRLQPLNVEQLRV